MHAIPAAAPVYLPPPSLAAEVSTQRRIAIAAGILGAFVIGLLIGVAIGRAGDTATQTAAPVAAVELGQLGVSSLPADGNVTVDGRFVGVSPIERLELDAGKHSIVIDAFGYQPYAGTLQIAARDKMSLKVTLAAIGGTGTTSGNISGGGKATKAAIPPSALLPATRSDAAGGKDAKDEKVKEPPPKPTRAAVSYEPPPRPRRDCNGEKSRCRDTCWRAGNDCDYSCPGCSVCMSNQTSDECRQLCESCRGSCKRNKTFCETTCDGQYDNCEASQ